MLNVRKDGSEFWVQFIIVPVTDKAGWFTHWVSIQRDVTDRRRRLDELRTMVRVTTEVVLLVDLDGTVRASSPAADRTLAVNEDGLAGACIADFVLPEQQGAVREALDSLTRPDGVDVANEMLLHTTSGWRWFETVARLARVDDTGRTVVITAVDITERRKERAALQEARERFRGAFADAPIAGRFMRPMAPSLKSTLSCRGCSAETKRHSWASRLTIWCTLTTGARADPSASRWSPAASPSVAAKRACCMPTGGRWG